MADNGATTPPTPPNAPAQQALAQGAEQEKIAVHVRDQSGQELTFKIRKQTLLEKVMDTFSQKLGKAKGTLRFFHDGDRVNVGDTPESKDIEDGDTIEAHQEQIGGTKGLA